MKNCREIIEMILHQTGEDKTHTICGLSTFEIQNSPSDTFNVGLVEFDNTIRPDSRCGSCFADEDNITSENTEHVHQTYDTHDFSFGGHWMIEYCECDAMQLRKFDNDIESHSQIAAKFDEHPTEDYIVQILYEYAQINLDQFTDKQAEAIIRRKCNFTLTTTERRHLQIIRDKIQKAYAIISEAEHLNFEDI